MAIPALIILGIALTGEQDLSGAEFAVVQHRAAIAVDFIVPIHHHRFIAVIDIIVMDIVRHIDRLPA